MEKYLQDLIDLLRTLVGDAAPLYVLQQLREIGIKPPVQKLTITQKETLLNNIADNVVAQVVSPRRVAMFKSHMYYLMHISAVSAAKIASTEGSKWSG